MLGWILSAVGVSGIAVAAIMFPAFGALLIRMLNGLWEIARKIPWYIWVAIAAALIIWRLVVYHNDTVAQAYADGDKAGYGRAMDEVRVKAEENRKKAEEARRKAEAASAIIVKEIQDANARTIKANRDLAAALRLRGPGKAKARIDRPAADLPGVASGAGTAPAGAAADATMATIPWIPLVDFGESHDSCMANVHAWETWWDRHKAIYDNWQPPPDK